ncbi:hypothetical protein FHW96_000282 [Novosphingobium sp. SG751A]|uniref:portal protein n=1 Tax=Novosphingobium sp. SG751A TaxID=2587000 RepID=UPI0020A6A3EE|nr:portal protein [Novosphingobium sp. SG751A]NOW44155.1 hypothetical protein [Novosphingobium sp. SG751A]
MDQAKAQTLRQSLQTQLEGMKSIRTDYEGEWNDIARFAQPARSRFLTNARDRGGRRRIRNNRLLDPKGIEAFRTLTNGMTSGLSSISRPWFLLTIGDPELAQHPEVKAWLAEVEKRLYDFLAFTNFYGALKAGYAELGLFGTEACVMVEDRQFGAVCHAMTAGEYWIAISASLKPDTLFRYCPMDVRQAVQTFGARVAPWVRQAYNASNYTQLVEYYQAIQPNPDYNPEKLGSKPYRSVYWDQGDTRADGLTRVSGYDEQPFWAPRWDVVGGDTYGVSPGMDALPALRELQMQTKRRNEAIDGMVKPEKIAPPSVRLTGEPGRTVRGTGITADQIIIPYQIPHQAVLAIGGEIDKLYVQIDALSYADLFNAITNMQGIQPRNMEEIASRNEEKLTQLGPVIERVSDEKLQPAIDRAFGIMDRGGMLPPVPSVLAQMAGMPIKVEFISILHQMQRMIGIGQMERVVGFIGNLAGADPTALDKLDTDATIDEYAYRVGAPVKMLRSDEDAQKIRQQRAQQQQAQMAAMAPAAQQGAQAARLLSETDAGGQSMLDRLIQP